MEQDRFRFRHWDTVNGKMYNHGEIQLFDGGAPFMLFKEGEMVRFLSGLITMGCTGYKDKNNNFIYEMDVVQLEPSQYALVVWQYQKYRLIPLGNFKLSNVASVSNFENCIVVGNVYATKSALNKVLRSKKDSWIRKLEEEK